MPGLTSLEQQRMLAKTQNTKPPIMITGHGDTQMAFAPIKTGAYDFVEKPFDEE
jgi:two-component system C4-dicarboxylate transport response regulator DctD